MRAEEQGSAADHQGSIPALILALISTNSQVRSNAIDSLKEIGEPAIPALIQALKYTNEQVRSGAASALGNIRPVSAPILSALADALGDKSDDVGHSAGFALASIGPEAKPAVTALIQALQHPSARVRGGACWALRSIGPEADAAVPHLGAALRDQATRWLAVAALSNIVPNFVDRLTSDVAPFNDILEGDHFLNHTCLRCGAHGALFATPRMFSACPKCLAERIRRLRELGGELPIWIHYLEGSAEATARRQAKSDETALTVSLGGFLRCSSCDALIREKDARYYFAPGTHSSPPYCLECYERKRRGE
ncbi:MAG: hypothetical protein AUG89_09260 [Acidobacteria bacterium 13_1_20CM_4_56_7]|nr:MAG: hypothetical protein AUG89_09260 [Acidobacteria bacterium 13_1_20CM_4_56_7]